MTEDIRQEVMQNLDQAQRADFDDVDEEIALLEKDIAETPEEGLALELRGLQSELKSLKAEGSGDAAESKRHYEDAEEIYKKANDLYQTQKQESETVSQEPEPELARKALEIYRRGAANHEEIVEMIHGLSFEEIRQQELIAKYGKGFGGVFLARCKAFFVGELDSHLISGVSTKQDWAEGSKAGEAARKGIISVFNRQNASAAAAAIAIGVLTGGLGAPAAGVLMGGSIGRFSAELFASRHEGNARIKMLEADREHWLRLKELTAEYRSETDPEAQKIKLQTFLDEYYLTNETSASRQKFEQVGENFMAVNKRWNGIKNICQSLGGIAGLGGGFLYGHAIGYFSGIKGGLTVLKGQKVFHGVQKINGIWNFVGHAGEVVGSQTVPSGQIAYHVMNAANPGAAEIAARIYTAAAIKALPTLGALCVAGLRHTKTKKYYQEAEDQFTYYNQSWRSNRMDFIGQPSDQAQSSSIETQTQTQVSRPESQGVERTPEGVITREQTFDDTKYKFSRSAAELILALVTKYEDLDGVSEEERKRKFLEAAKKILQEKFAVHYRNEHKKDRSDVDGETVLNLIKDILGKEFKDPRKVKDKLVAPGESKEGHLTADSGGFHGIHVPKGEESLFSDTVNVDHHGKESGNDLSASLLMFNVLRGWGFYEKRSSEEVERLQKLVEFVTYFDNMSGPFKSMENYKKSYRTVLGLRRFLAADGLYRFFTENRDPDYLRELTDEELEALLLKGKEKNEKDEEVDYDRSADIEKQIKADLELLEKIEKIDTPHGKTVIDNGAKLSKDAFAASGYDIHVQTFLNKEAEELEGFKISNMPEGVDLPDGQRIRAMWICNEKPKNGTTLETIKAALTARTLAKAA